MTALVRCARGLQRREDPELRSEDPALRTAHPRPPTSPRRAGRLRRRGRRRPSPSAAMSTPPQVSMLDASGEVTFTLRLPSARLDDALKRLSKLAHVGSLTQGANDITNGFVSVTDRLSDERSARRALLRSPAKARTSNSRSRRCAPGSASTAADRPAQGPSRLAAPPRGLRHRGRHRLRLRLQADTAAAPACPATRLHDAGRVVEVLAGVALVAGAALAPAAALVALLVLLAGRVMRRRRREGALDAA